MARETCKNLGSGEYRKMTEVEDQQARYPPTYTSSVRGYVFAVFAVPPRTEGHLHQWSSCSQHLFHEDQQNTIQKGTCFTIWGFQGICFPWFTFQLCCIVQQRGNELKVLSMLAESGSCCVDSESRLEKSQLCLACPRVAGDLEKLVRGVRE